MHKVTWLIVSWLIGLAMLLSLGCKPRQPEPNGAPGPSAAAGSSEKSQPGTGGQATVTPGPSVTSEAGAAAESPEGQSTLAPDAARHQPDQSTSTDQSARSDPAPTSDSNSGTAFNSDANTKVDSDAHADLSANSKPMSDGDSHDSSMNVALASGPKPTSVSTLRLVVLTKSGPRFIKLDVHIGGHDLAHGLESAAQGLAEQLGLNFDQPVTWSELLDKPLVTSGWLGNLVPTAEQRDQLIGLYDLNKDERVDAAEFRAFLTRGLSRGPQLKLIKERETPPLLPSESPWGPLDEDQDGQLTAAEIEKTNQSIMRYDFDADRIVTAGELRSNGEASAMMMNQASRGIYDFKPIAQWDLNKPDPMVRAIMDFYSYTDTISRELFSGWTDGRFQAVDANRDGQLTRAELMTVSDSLVDIESIVSFPDALKSPASRQAAGAQWVSSAPPKEDTGQVRAWLTHPGGGRIELDKCLITYRLRDDYEPSAKERFVEFLQQSMRDPQFEAGLTNLLELKGGAFDLVRQPSPGMTAAPAAANQTPPTSSSQSESDVTGAEMSKPPSQAGSSEDTTSESVETRAWGWVVGPRQYQVQVAWAVSPSPWFELLDANGDQRLSTTEIGAFRETAKRLDEDEDGLLSVEEMPLALVLTVGRSDSRGGASRLGGTAVEKRGTNATSAPTWFTGMDYNFDGELSQSEFLGEATDFEKLDRNRDGVIEAREINTP